MSVYRINETDLNNFYENNKDIKELKIILSDFLNKNKYISPKNNIRQQKINLILSMCNSDENIIILIWLFVVITILILFLL
tara:strand:- start:866 stop:1108 length:243 start_codon:yes stop_codon:yes gene_type:complete